MTKWLLASVILLMVLSQGCVSKSTIPKNGTDWRKISSQRAAPFIDFDLLNGRTGRPLTTGEFHTMIANADVILLGEIHGSVTDHRFQLELLRYLTEHRPNLAFSMEQFNRAEQAVLDSFLAGGLAEGELESKTGLSGWPDWETNYQPLLDHAKMREIPVIAANAARKYSSIAYKQGWDGLRALPAAEQALFSFPLETDDRSYRQRFIEAMEGAKGLTPEMIESMYRGQLLWDATMAESIVDALQLQSPVLHIAGRFHIEKDGGIILQLNKRNPSLRIVSIVDHQDSAPNFPADIVYIFRGATEAR